MKLWLITQDTARGYDTYSAAVVAAETIGRAKRIHPDGEKELPIPSEEYNDTWASLPAQVTAEYLGEAKRGTKRGVICASFHAG